MGSVVTIGDLLDHHYGNWAKKLVAALWALFSFGILSVQIKGMGHQQPIISDKVIWSLSNQEEREAANQRNRRVEIQVIGVIKNAVDP